MAGVRDPAFWKRFSYAVHLDEEQGEKQKAPYVTLSSENHTPILIANTREWSC